MGKKYIVEIGRLERLYKAYVSENGKPSMTWLSPEVGLKPYTEPDLEQVRKEAYEDGYKTAKVQCNIQSEKDMREVGERHYQKGLSDAWEAARKIAVSVPLGGMSQLAIKRMFGVEWQYVLMNCTPATVIEKLRQREQKQKQEEEQIHVGDEVKDDKDDIGICTEISYPANSMHIMYADGTATDISLTGVTKTGRHFPEIAAVLRKMKEES